MPPGPDRDAQIRRFLTALGWGGAERHPLAGDASARRYERLHRGGETAVLMDAPPDPGGDNPADFLRIARHLLHLGLSAPRPLGEDLAAGLLLLEDLGEDLFARVIDTDPSREAPLLLAAVEVLAHLQSQPMPPGLPDLSAADWADAAMLCLDSYAPTAPEPRARAAAVLAEAMARYADGPRVLILRDFHAENLLWLPGRDGLARVGLLDFQLAQSGQPGYDLVSLVQDARRDVAAATEAAALRHFAMLTGAEAGRLAAAHAVLGAQRALRIIGVFARLARRDGKPGYLRHLPRVWRQLQGNLRHPALADLAAVLEPVLPAPTPAVIAGIEVRCSPAP
jgi:aminoglycoside/choline kinase family phosphotransferase